MLNSFFELSLNWCPYGGSTTTTRRKIIGSNNLLTDISVLHILKKWNIFLK